MASVLGDSLISAGFISIPVFPAVAHRWLCSFRLFKRFLKKNLNRSFSKKILLNFYFSPLSLPPITHIQPPQPLNNQLNKYPMQKTALSIQAITLFTYLRCCGCCAWLPKSMVVPLMHKNMHAFYVSAPACSCQDSKIALKAPINDLKT